MHSLKTYITALILFFVIDFIWLVIIAKNLYQEKLGYLMNDQPNWIIAALFYLIFLAGLVFFVINPALTKESWLYALLAGMLFGFITYSTYDLTNLATLKDWPYLITIIDLLWGSALGGTVSILTYFIIKKIS